MAGTLSGGNMGAVRRIGGAVERPAGPWTPAVHDYLCLLRASGLPVPEPLDIRGDREVVGFLDGEVPAYPLPEWVWDDRVLQESARLLRHLHDATADTGLVRADRVWQQPVREPREVVCHNDFAPHNLVFDADHRLVGVIDLDMAAPGPRLRDLANLAVRVVPLEAPDPAQGPPLEAAQRARRLRLLLDAYGSDLRVDDVLRAAASGLRDLADFTDAKADELTRPDLRGHAVKYRTDAAFLESEFSG